jgi:hypothetical protein
LPGSIARQPCPAALPGSIARQHSPAALPGSIARQPYPAALPAELQAFFNGHRLACSIAYFCRPLAGSLLQFVYNLIMSCERG